MNTVVAVNYKTGKFWKFLQFPVTRIFLAVFTLIFVVQGIQISAKASHIKPHSLPGVLIGLLIIAAVITVYSVYVRLIERRTVSELGISKAAPEFGSGFIAGVLMFTLTMLILWLLGIITINMGGGLTALGYPLLDALIAGVVEETLIRGVLFRIIEESLGSWIALGISAAIFGALHAFNPGATLISSLAIALEAGILLAAVFMYTRRLWMVIGLHAAWNFTEGGIFGASVSGNAAQGMFASRIQGPGFLTGGKLVRKPPSWQYWFVL